MGSPRRELCPSHSCHLSFRGIQFLCPTPVSGHCVGWWVPRAGTMGTPHGHLSGQDLTARACPTPSREQGTEVSQPWALGTTLGMRTMWQWLCQPDKKPWPQVNRKFSGVLFLLCLTSYCSWALFSCGIQHFSRVLCQMKITLYNEKHNENTARNVTGSSCFPPGKQAWVNFSLLLETCFRFPIFPSVFLPSRNNSEPKSVQNLQHSGPNSG